MKFDCHVCKNLSFNLYQKFEIKVIPKHIHKNRKTPHNLSTIKTFIT